MTRRAAMTIGVLAYASILMASCPVRVPCDEYIPLWNGTLDGKDHVCERCGFQKHEHTLFAQQSHARLKAGLMFHQTAFSLDWPPLR